MLERFAIVLVPLFAIACKTTTAEPGTDAHGGSNHDGSTDGTPASCDRRVVVDFEGPALIQAATDDATANHAKAIASSRTVPKYRAADGARAAAIAEILTQVRATLNVYPVQILTARPTSGDYQLVVVTETDTDLGLAGQSLPALYDPRCPSDATGPKAVGFVFEQVTTGTFSSPTQIANRIMQTIGGMNLVPWSNLTGDCMCGDGDACGTNQCEIGGNVLGSGTCGTGAFNEADAFLAITSC